ncbi:hypothetical protein SISSUDRAFT_1068032 [Sistotremastrum suecicum HHB10207 ss-3]|uniref:Uncharacterized protein n=1 Tax=Sistotremastrum suecicum HHB10207 ss-3 TaxID=1314776 RepID=A0A165WHC6_9AGAM|nr:hypothetical protein SISSUDRAFT_1068032 [Sistotremastrum suecicum HHB10207 ss-3]
MSIGMARPVLRWITCGVGPTDRNLALVPSALLASSFREAPAHWLFDILGTITLDWQVLPGAIIVQQCEAHLTDISLYLTLYMSCTLLLYN